MYWCPIIQYKILYYCQLMQQKILHNQIKAIATTPSKSRLYLQGRGKTRNQILILGSALSVRFSEYKATIVDFERCSKILIQDNSDRAPTMASWQLQEHYSNAQRSNSNYTAQTRFMTSRQHLDFSFFFAYDFTEHNIKLFDTIIQKQN